MAKFKPNDLAIIGDTFTRAPSMIGKTVRILDSHNWNHVPHVPGVVYSVKILDTDTGTDCLIAEEHLKPIYQNGDPFGVTRVDSRLYLMQISDTTGTRVEGTPTFGYKMNAGEMCALLNRVYREAYAAGAEAQRAVKGD